MTRPRRSGPGTAKSSCSFFTPSRRASPSRSCRRRRISSFNSKPQLAEGAGFHAEVCENFWDVLVGDTNNGHGEGSIAGDIDENVGNEAFITDADLDNNDQPPPPGN